MGIRCRSRGTGPAGPAGTGATARRGRALARSLLDRRDDLLSRLRAVADIAPGFKLSRIHGDFHLGQVLLAQNDVAIIDFEGNLPAALRNGGRNPRPCATWRGCCGPSTMPR
ncbi:phosphotransferase [Paracoccus aerius]